MQDGIGLLLPEKKMRLEDSYQEMWVSLFV